MFKILVFVHVIYEANMARLLAATTIRSDVHEACRAEYGAQNCVLIFVLVAEKLHSCHAPALVHPAGPPTKFCVEGCSWML